MRIKYESKSRQQGKTQQEKPTMTTDDKNHLVSLDDIQAPVLYGSDDEVSAVVERVREAAGSFVFDMTTAKGRAECASVAHRVARSKTYLDSMGKDFVSELKKKVGVVDARRKTIKDELDAIKNEVRRPLNEYEEREKARVKEHTDALEGAKRFINSIPILNNIEAIDETAAHAARLLDRDYEEYQDQADKLKELLSSTVLQRRGELKEAQRVAAENERLKKEAEERRRKEHEERVAREAREEAERAEREAVEKAERERREEEDRRIKAEQDKLEAERKAFEAEKQAEQEKRDAEAREVEAAKKAEAEKQAAAEKAIKQEQARREAEIAEEKRQAAARQADVDHRAKINNAAVDALVSAGLTAEQGKMAVKAIASGQVANVTISY